MVTIHFYRIYPINTNHSWRFLHSTSTGGEYYNSNIVKL